MKEKPFSIRIFLPDGTPEGVKVIEKSNWTGIGLVVPRSLLAEAKKRNEFARTGVYLLVGQSDDSDLPTIYIGQGDPVRDRLDSHIAKKEFWTYVAFFVTRDDSLNKAHIGFLEAELIRRAKDAKRAKLDNQNTPQPSSLTEADTADMTSFLCDILSILPLVGLTAFEKPREKLSGRSILTMTIKGIKASGYESAQGFVVLAGSVASTIESKHIHAYQSSLRNDLRVQGVLVNAGEFLTFAQDYLFTSSSTAAAVILGRPASGPQSWKDEHGRWLKDIQEAEAV